MENIKEWFNCSLTPKGSYVAQGRRPGPGERKLYLLVEGTSKADVDKAAASLHRLLEETTLQVGFSERERKSGKYSVL